MCNAVFGATPLSKLFLNVREKRSLCYYASSNLEKMKGLLLVSSGIEFGQYQQARDEISRPGTRYWPSWRPSAGGRLRTGSWRAPGAP